MAAACARSTLGRHKGMFGRAIAVLGWLIAFAFVAIGAYSGLRGGPLKLPFRGGAGSYTLNGTSARIAGGFYLVLLVMLLALPVLILSR